MSKHNRCPCGTDCERNRQIDLPQLSSQTDELQTDTEEFGDRFTFFYAPRYHVPMISDLQMNAESCDPYETIFIYPNPS